MRSVVHSPVVAVTALLAFAQAAVAQSELELLPKRPEVVAREGKDGSTRFTLRGRDCAIVDFLATLAERGGFRIESDDLAKNQIKTTIASVELYDRRAEQIVELLAADAGVDAEVNADGKSFKLVGVGAKSTRPLLRNSIEQFYKMALARQGDDETNARCLAGLAEILQSSGDYAGAYASFEQLLSDHSTSPYSVDAELNLADCYMQLEQNARANQVLRSFLAKCSDPKRAEKALRRLVKLLLEQKRFQELATMHEAFERIGVLEPETLAELADAGAVMMEESDVDVATFLLGSFRAFPKEHAMLGPVLALAFTKRGDDEASRIVLERTAQALDHAIDSTSALLAYSELSERAGHYPAALLFAERAVKTSTNNPILRRRAHLLLADVYDALGDAPRVYHHLWEAEQLSSQEDAPKIALRAADFAMERNEPEHARLLFQSASQYESAKLDAELGVARALMLAGDTSRALVQLREMLSGETGAVEKSRIELLLVDCYREAHQYGDALTALEGRVNEAPASEAKK